MDLFNEEVELINYFLDLHQAHSSIISLWEIIFTVLRLINFIIKPINIQHKRFI